jgi:hypothetical protein
MAGGGLDRECLLYYSKVATWAHERIPHIWPNSIKSDLRDPNKHLNALAEVWWLSKFHGADWRRVEHSVPVNPLNKKGKNFDWRIHIPRHNTILNVEVKRRIGDIARAIDVPSLKYKSFFEDLNKFPNPNPPHILNVACIRLFGPINEDVESHCRYWLQANPAVSAIALYGPAIRPKVSFCVITQPGLEFVGRFISPPDYEDEIYVAPFYFATGSPRPISNQKAQRL